ncbi:MAG: hypothetical protein ACE5FL_00495 [Myxococcota bacterium]
MRRTDRRPRSARSLALAVAFLVVPHAAAHGSAEVSGVAAVEQGFANYRGALMARDGARAAAAVSRNSLAYYDNIRRLALKAEKEDLAVIEGTERMLVLGIRHQAPKGLLESATPLELLAHAVDVGLVSDASVAATGLGRVKIDGDMARAFVVVDGEPTRSVLQFVREDGVWKFDLEFAMRASSGLVAAIATQSGLSEDAVILNLLSQGSGRPVGPEIWRPLTPE